MKKLIFAFLIIIVIPVIVIAYSYCRESCRDDLNMCKKNCNLLDSGRGSELVVSNCKENCMDDYDHCINKCHDKD